MMDEITHEILRWKVETQGHLKNKVLLMLFYGIHGVYKFLFLKHVVYRRRFMQSIPLDEKVFIGGDLNGHVGAGNDGFERVHGGFGYGNRNEEGESILEFASAYDLVLANTSFRKRESHIITFSSGYNNSQIDFLLTRKIDRKICRDCKVIPGEALTT
ncbi:hypothetical protein Scep_010330 [Stephania cephalantha]|uniref:Craniofacial development protein 2-like n=1 Tax=Stephania cephalantha TaxID=152367 RepID=A0AAP0PF38_9MAGN